MNAFLAVCGIVLFGGSLLAAEPTLPHGAIPDAFSACYQDGTTAYSQAVAQSIPEKGREALAHFLSGKMEAIPTQNAECQFYFSVGAFTAEATLQQFILLEYLLEQEANLGEPESVSAALTNHFAQRLSLVGLPSTTLDRFELNSTLAQSSLKNLKTSLRTMAEENQSAVPFGRFVFTSYESNAPLTLYEYPESAEGIPVYSTVDPKNLRPGSYQRIAESLHHNTRQLVLEYLNWRPGLIYGEDSFLYGAFWRAIGWDDYPSVREIKEQDFERRLMSLIRNARRLHLKMETFYKMEQAFSAKQRAVLDREIHAFDRIFVGVCAAPLIPVGMYVGTAGLAYAGLSSLTAANTSAMLSLGTLSTFASVGVHSAIQDARASRAANLPFRFSDAADHIMAATVSSFPLAAVLPAAVGGTAASAKFLIVSGYQLLVNGMDVAKTGYSLGFREAAKELGALGIRGIQTWATAWWNNPTLFIQYAAESSITIVFEIGFRQLHLEGENKFYYVDSNGVGHINEQSLFTIGTTLIAGAITKPIVLVPTFSSRFWTYRAVSLFSSVITQLVVSGKVDPSRLLFDQAYGIGVGMPAGEGTRLIKFSDYVLKSSAARQYLLLTILETAMKFGMTPIRTFLVDRYVKDESASVVMDIRVFLERQYLIDASEFSDDEILVAIEEMRR